MVSKIGGKRIAQFDIARVFAILCVVLCHCSEAFYSYTADGYIEASVFSSIIMTSFFIIGRLGVPIFLFLSGALLLRKEIETDSDILLFYKKNLLPLVIVNIVWVFIYNLFYIVIGEISFDPVSIIREIFFMKQIPASQMWYMPMIIGVYLGIPFIAKIIKSFSLKSLLVIFAMIFISSFVFPLINTILNLQGTENSWNLLLLLNFFGGAYGLYVVTGYLIVQKYKAKIKSSWACLLVALGFIAMMVTQICVNKNGNSYSIWYNDPFLFMCSVGLFTLFCQIRDKKVSKKLRLFFEYFSQISFAIFLVHIMIMESFVPLISKLSINVSVKVVMTFLCTTIVSASIVYVLSKIKVIAKHVFLIKKSPKLKG